MYTYIISVTLSYKYILYMEVAHTNCLASGSNTFIGKTPVPSVGGYVYLIDKKSLFYWSESVYKKKRKECYSIGSSCISY